MLSCPVHGQIGRFEDIADVKACQRGEPRYRHLEALARGTPRGSDDSAFAVLMNLRAFEPDLDCVSAINIAYDPTRFKHDPSHGMCGVRQAALRYFHAVNEDKNVIVIILVNLANGFFVTHGSTLWRGFNWTRLMIRKANRRWRFRPSVFHLTCRFYRLFQQFSQPHPCCGHVYQHGPRSFFFGDYG
jgi:hypothetical protein